MATTLFAGIVTFATVGHALAASSMDKSTLQVRDSYGGRGADGSRGDRREDRRANTRRDRGGPSSESRSDRHAYDSRRHGQRYDEPRKGHRHYHNGHYYAHPWWVTTPGRPSTILRP